MTLTRPPGPLTGGTEQLTNYEVRSPAHRLLMHPFPRRVRAEFAGETVLDTRAGMLLHETGLKPQLYVPETDLRADLLEPTDLSTHCPFKGDAAYRSIRVGDRVAENAVWHYPNPVDSAPWLVGYAALYTDRVDRWFDEQDEVVSALPDPFHRVDVRATDQRVVVKAGDIVLADSTRALLLSETGLPNRYYLPEADIRVALKPTDTRTACAYKGWASYWTPELDGVDLTDAVWGYHEPLPESARIAGYRAFLHDGLTIELGDGPR